MVRHLIGHGHRRVAIIAGAKHNIDGEQRRAGYRAALSEAGILPIRTSRLRGILRKIQALRRYGRCSNLVVSSYCDFAANDAMAIGALERAARSRSGSA